MVPNAVALLTITCEPGKQINIALGLFGAMAPIGAAGGSLISAIFAQQVSWNWLFFFLALIGTFLFSGIMMFVPTDRQSDPNGKIDWIRSKPWGGWACAFQFHLKPSCNRRLGAPYNYALLIVAISHFVLFAFWEAKFAAQPIMPTSLWAEPSFLPPSNICDLSRAHVFRYLRLVHSYVGRDDTRYDVSIYGTIHHAAHCRWSIRSLRLRMAHSCSCSTAYPCHWCCHCSGIKYNCGHYASPANLLASGLPSICYCLFLT
jgi:hypothetical protein